MALLYRCQRFPTQKTNQDIGPAYYDPKQMAPHSPECSSVFKKREKEHDAEIETVGPGYYDLSPRRSPFKNQNTNAIFKLNKKQVKHKDETINEEKDRMLIDSQKVEQENKNTEKPRGKLKKPEQSEYHFNHNRKLNLSEDLHFPKPIPSIPSYDQSYGYRVDLKTNQLILNQNPNILLQNKIGSYQNAKLFMESLYNGPGAYFRKDGPLQRIKGLKWIADTKMNQKQSQNEGQNLKQSAVVYHPKWNQKGNKMTSKQRRMGFGAQSKQIKQKMVLNGIKRKFQKYVSQDQIQKAFAPNQNKRLNHSHTVQPYSRQEHNQCFMTKQTRFDLQQTSQRVQNNDRGTTKKVDENVINRKKVPFQVGQQRFYCKPSEMSKVGPGQYQKIEQCSKNRLGSCWPKQNREQRLQRSFQIPGPGFYNSESKLLQNSRSFKIPKQRALCMKQKMMGQNQAININNKPEKDKTMICGSKPKRTKQDKENLILNQKKVIQKIVQVVSDSPKNYQNIIKAQSKTPHTIKIKKMPHKQHKQIARERAGPGPGSFDPASSLIKKSHNITSG